MQWTKYNNTEYKKCPPRVKPFLAEKIVNANVREILLDEAESCSFS